MEVLNATQQLHKAATGVSFIVASSLQQRVQQLSSREQLCDEVHLPGVQTPSTSLMHAAKLVVPLLLSYFGRTRHCHHHQSCPSAASGTAAIRL